MHNIFFKLNTIKFNLKVGLSHTINFLNITPAKTDKKLINNKFEKTIIIVMNVNDLQLKNPSSMARP